MRSPARARVLILSDREVAPAISRCGTYEFEDVACAVDAVDLRSLGSRGGRLGRRLERRLPSLFRAPAHLDRSEPYDLLFVSLHSLPELARLHPLGRILRLAKRTAINIDELWINELDHHAGDLVQLERFDHVYSCCAGGVESLRVTHRIPAQYLAPSVDALRFAPPSHPNRRVIDLHLMGRRRAELHQALREAATKSDRYYHFDTIQFNPRVSDHVEHRMRLAELVQRTRFFVVDIANSDRPEVIASQQEFGPRYVEGAAGGSILIGRAPKTAAYDAEFWPGAVIPIEPDSAEIERVLSELDDDPERADRIRNTNAAQVLRRHDNVYRWEQILRAAGLEPLPALVERKRMLERRASEIEGRSA
jgi:hypothetical protein